MAFKGEVHLKKNCTIQYKTVFEMLQDQLTVQNKLGIHSLSLQCKLILTIINPFYHNKFRTIISKISKS